MIGLNFRQNLVHTLTTNTEESKTGQSHVTTFNRAVMEIVA